MIDPNMKQYVQLCFSAHICYSLMMIAPICWMLLDVRPCISGRFHGHEYDLVYPDSLRFTVIYLQLVREV